MTHIILCKRQSGFEIHFIPNGLEKYMSLLWERHLIFINKMQVTISSLDILVKNLSENDFKFLSPKFFGEKLELVKRKSFYAYKYIESF